MLLYHSSQSILITTLNSIINSLGFIIGKQFGHSRVGLLHLIADVSHSCSIIRINGFLSLSISSANIPILPIKLFSSTSFSLFSRFCRLRFFRSFSFAPSPSARYFSSGICLRTRCFSIGSLQILLQVGNIIINSFLFRFRTVFLLQDPLKHPFIHTVTLLKLTGKVTCGITVSGMVPVDILCRLDQ